MTSFYLFTGENTFAVTERKKMWIAEFARKHGSDAVIRLDARDCTVQSILDDVSSAPFLAEKRLVVLQGIPKWQTEDIDLLEANIHPDVLLLLVEPQLDKRLSTTKKLLSVAKVDTFPQLTPERLKQWALQCITTAGCSIEPIALQLLLENCDGEQTMLSSELQKLITYASTREITLKDINDLSISCSEKKVWGILALLEKKNLQGALNYLQRLRRQGESVHGLWSILLWITSLLAPVYSCVQAGEKNPSSIAKKTGVSFYHVRSVLPMIQSFSHSDMLTLLDWVVECDRGLKTGQYRATVEKPQELEMLLDRLLLRLTNC